VADLRGGGKGQCPPPPKKSRLLLGDFVPQTPTGPPPLDPAGDPLNWPPPSSFSGSAPAEASNQKSKYAYRKIFFYKNALSRYNLYTLHRVK